MQKVIDSGREGFTLRFGDENDVDLILELIRELADYERLSHEVVADADTLRASLFGERLVAEVVIAEIDAEPVGFALFFHNISTFLGRPGLYLEDLFIRPAYRGRGVGKTMMRFLAQVARERGCARLEWSVLDWNKPAIEFYKGLGARALDEWTVYRVTGAELDELAAQFRSHGGARE